MLGSPIGAAIVGGTLTLLFGVSLSRLMIRLGWLKRMSWLSAVVAPVSVAVFIYLMTR